MDRRPRPSINEGRCTGSCGMSNKGILPKHEALLVEANESNRREVIAAVLKMLEEDRRLAYATKQPAVAVSASCAIAKLLNLFEQPISVAAVSIEELEPRALARRIAFALRLAG